MQQGVNSEILEAGYYVNMFEVSVSPTKADFMIAERKLYPSLKELREEIKSLQKDVYLYASENKIFGYGRDMDWLTNKGFTKETVELCEEPKLTGRLILEGVILKAKESGYEPLPREKGRTVLFSDKDYTETSNSEVRVYRAYDVRSIYLLDIFTKKLKFYLIVDLCFLLRGKSGDSLNYQQIKQLYGSDTLREVRAIQGDMVQVSEGVYKANLQASRYRLMECIIPFAKELGEFQLPCGVNARINPRPVGVVEVV